MWVITALSRKRELLPICWNYRCTVGVHDIFHVSQLKKCFRVPTEEAPLETFAVLKVGQNRDLTRSNAIKIDPSTTKIW